MRHLWLIRASGGISQQVPITKKTLELFLAHVFRMVFRLLKLSRRVVTKTATLDVSKFLFVESCERDPAGKVTFQEPLSSVVVTHTSSHFMQDISLTITVISHIKVTHITPTFHVSNPCHSHKPKSPIIKNTI